jgi:hypothetical protein
MSRIPYWGRKMNRDRVLRHLLTDLCDSTSEVNIYALSQDGRVRLIEIRTVGVVTVGDKSVIVLYPKEILYDTTG